MSRTLTAPPAGRRTPVGPRTGWRALLLRLFVVVPPAQLVGVLAGGGLVTGLDLLPGAGRAPDLIMVVAGAVTGLALGLLVPPPAGALRPHLLAGAGLGVASAVLLSLLAAARLGDASAHPGGLAVAAGVAWLAGVQTLVAWALWLVRTRVR